MSVRLSTTAALLALSLAVGCSRERTPAGESAGMAPQLKIEQGVPEAIKAQLAARPAFLGGDSEGDRVLKAVRAFYEKRDYAPAWIDGRRPTKQLDALLDALGAAEQEGLDPAVYGTQALIAHRQNAGGKQFSRDAFPVDDIDDVEVWSTWAFMSYVSDLADGVTDLSQISKTWGMRPKPVDAAKVLNEALADGNVEKAIADAAPQHPEYAALRKALADHRRIATWGGWPKVPADIKLKEGAEHDAVPVLRKRLAMTHDYKGNADDPSRVYDKALVDAVKLFQLRHGLAEDGVVAGRTLAAMNVPVAERVRQIELNMERWRWLPRDLGENHARVNIPEYRLDLWEGDNIALAMRVVVGTPANKTPVFADQMTYIVFSPYWNVPPSIASEETLPAVQSDPGYLGRNNLEVVGTSGSVIDPSSVDWSNPDSYRFRQKPGTRNSLGLVKFMFPNQHNVYLHDTPADALFARPARAFSHGCVRVEQPTKLARYLLRDEKQWTEERIDAAMHAGREQHVKLPKPIPVYLLYMTARASHADGAVHFREDVYGHDAQQGRAFEQRMARLQQRSAMMLDALSPGSDAAGAR
ncbi:MAG TPA: L,D-transpeptidase family protein [Vicinamibacterales bacterium]|nr:L,D-transpeptidase family protein [Vicinamibacterales bacterium]